MSVLQSSVFTIANLQTSHKPSYPPPPNKWKVRNTFFVRRLYTFNLYKTRQLSSTEILNYLSVPAFIFKALKLSLKSTKNCLLHSSVLLWVLIPNHPNIQKFILKHAFFAWKPTPSNQTLIHDFLNTGYGWQLAAASLEQLF